MPVELKNADPSNSKISHSACRVVIGSFKRQMFPRTSDLEAGQSGDFPKAGTYPRPVVFFCMHCGSDSFFAKPVRPGNFSTRCNQSPCTHRECNMIGLKVFFANLSEFELCGSQVEPVVLVYAYTSL